jgi:hypothetical protein
MNFKIGHLTAGHQLVVKAALHAEDCDENPRQDGITYQTSGRGRVTVLDSGRINVTGDLINKVEGMGGVPYRHGLAWHP